SRARASVSVASLFFLFNDSPTPDIYTLSLHDALPISRGHSSRPRTRPVPRTAGTPIATSWTPYSPSRTTEQGTTRGREPIRAWRSEEHTSELQSRSDLVCRLLLEKKKKES